MLLGFSMHAAALCPPLLHGNTDFNTQDASHQNPTNMQSKLNPLMTETG